GKELQASGANKILVFPESTGHSGAYRPIGTILQGVLNRENQRKPDPGPASLDPMGNLAAVHLFDSAYCGSGDPTGACAGIRNYSLVHPERISSHFLKGTPTDVGTRTVIAKPCGDFPAPCSDLVPVNAAIGHLNIMNQNYSDSLSVH
ncbi:MAG: hypothetical protein EBX52_12280, partial [Proteobacteria bacterium]|nr:hypothetical protein [Pseudomonadota bacterium]